MDRAIYKKLTALLVFVTLIPVLCSCSFKKNAVITAATEFGEALKYGDSTELLRKTDGLDRDYKNLIKSYFKVDDYTEEGKMYCAHMLSSITYEVDADSVEIDKDTATVRMTFTIADHRALDGGDYYDINELCDAIDNCSKRNISIYVKFLKIDKTWYVTNFDDEDFKDLLLFFAEPMPAIGRSTLFSTAETVARSVLTDDPALALSVAASLTDTIDLPSYLDQLFDVNGDPTDEDKAFRAAVLSTMSYDIIEDSLIIDSQSGSVLINISFANYQEIAGQTFNKIDDIAPAVTSCSTITYEFRCEFVRVDTDWFAINLDSKDFAAFLLYKDFSISLKNIDGTYQATVDITDKFVAYVSSEYNISMPKDLEGRIFITSTLVLKDGRYEVTVDRDAFVANINTFVETNIDKIIMNMLGTTSAVGLDALAKIAGYKDYADMRQSVLDDVKANVATINTSGLESSGTYTLNDDIITLQSATDTMPGTIDNYGVITVTSPVNDPDAKKLLGEDTITLPFKKV